MTASRTAAFATYLKVALVLALGFVWTASPAIAFDKRVRAEEREYPWTGNLPACEDPAVVGLVIRRFDDRERD